MKSDWCNLLCKIYEANISLLFHFQIVDFLKRKHDFVDLIIKHIGTSAIMDLLLRLLTCIEPPQPRQEVLNVSKIFQNFCLTCVNLKLP